MVRVSDARHLTPRERAEVPEGLVRLTAGWRDLLEAIPPAFAWAWGALQARKPILERAELVGDRVAWSVRLPLYGDLERLEGPCFGCRALEGTPAGLPEDLGWLASTLGDCFVETDCSGTAPWGIPLGSVADRMFDGMLEALPQEAVDWVVLYEADGDWLCADLVSGRAHWAGTEWTGEPDVGYPSWRPVMHFVLWRLLDGGFVRPSDLGMLFAASPGANHSVSP